VHGHNPACQLPDITGFCSVSPAAEIRALGSAVTYLRCPVCGSSMNLSGVQLACRRHHSFDVARHGYVNLRAARAGPGTGDSTAMVAARDHFLGRGHYRPLAAAVRSLAAQGDSAGHGLVVDLAGGTGYYLAQILDGLPHRHGLCIDLSVPALRRASRAHPRAAALAADVWQRLPLAAHSAAVVLSVFGPRNAAEIDRILAADGALIIAAPGTGHLREILRPLGMIGIDPGKPRRLADAFSRFAMGGVTPVKYRLSLDHADLAALVAMGPSARHITSQTLAARIRALPDPATVTADLQIRVYRHRHPSAKSRHRT
jgi:23S rRNA (guanine745-N1)-methyltransferase